LRILITGISGFVGKHLLKVLLKNHHEIIGLDKRILGKDARINENVTFYHGNILDKSIVLKAMKNVDYIVHLAAEHQDFGILKEEYFKVNQQGTKKLLECASELNINNFLFYSSVAVYGYCDEPTTEKTEPNPDNYYGKSKIAAEKEIMKWYNQDIKNRLSIIIRPTVIYGKGMNDYANIYRLINTIYKKHFILVGKGNNIKSIAYVDNIVNATNFLLNNVNSGFHIFNYADKEHLQTKNIIKIISNSFNKVIPKINPPYKLTLLLAHFLDIFSKLTRINLSITADRIEKFNTPTYHKAEKILEYGFKPKILNSKGLKLASKWLAEKYKQKNN